MELLASAPWQTHEWEEHVGRAFNEEYDNRFTNDTRKVMDAHELLAQPHTPWLEPKERDNLEKLVPYLRRKTQQFGMDEVEVKILPVTGTSSHAGYNRIWVTIGDLAKLDWDMLEVRMTHELAHVRHKHALRGADGKWKDPDGKDQGPPDPDFHNRVELETDRLTYEMLDEPKKLGRALIHEAKETVENAKKRHTDNLADRTTALSEAVAEITQIQPGHTSLRARIRQSRELESGSNQRR